MSVQCVNVSMLEANIYSQTDIFSELRLQRSKHGSNSARSSEQQNMLGLGLFSTPKLLCRLLRKGKTKILALPLALPMSPYHAAVTKFG